MRAATDTALSPALQQALLRQRIELAIRETQQVRLPHTLVDLALAWVAWQAGVRDGVFAYLALMTLSHLGRSALLQRLLDRGRLNASQLMQVSMAALVWLGLIKAALSLAVFSQPSSDWHELWTKILVGNAAGGVATAAGHVRLYLAWAIPFGSGLVLGWILHDGLEGWLIALLVIVLIGVLTGYVREQGRAQERLLHVNESLREARDRAEQANATRTRFFAAASHDLRQPLTALSYGVAAVEAIATRQADAQLRQIGVQLRASLRDSQQLLASLLEVAELDAGAVQAEMLPLDLATLARELLTGFLPLAGERGLQLEGLGLDQAHLVCSDAALLRRLLANLLGNALKFTPPGGRVQLRIGDGGTADELLVEVIDNGPGIPVELQQRVFEAFFQIGNSTRQAQQGLGLGLSIVERLVELLGLRLTLDSESGQGCRFGLWLRRHDCSREPAGASN
ncbi:MAG: sensor histidine kinase [Inhella sp.]